MKINYEQIITTIIGGYIGALIPNNNSNIHPLIMSCIIGSLFSKCIYGDFDVGYQWTISDLYYWLFTILEALLGGIISINLQKINK
jgi:uncharacterized membrane protein YeaQ/YmgE (transglycosylase-associated protein family)